MQRLALLVAFFVGAVAAFASPTGTFFENLTPEQRRAAGLDQLTPEQQAALSVLADRWAAEKAEPAVSRARAETAAAVRAQAQAEEKKALGFAKKAAADDAIRTRIAGAFRGWGKGTVFQLENGQSWVVEDSEARYFPKRDNPEVELKPSTFGSWKLYLLPEGLWVRVKRVS